ncbi:MAG TPA: class I SAM-dependent methyltransferase [Candidatus Elarobacter sp.]|jgi:hypothetical protein|nr:class I SAM-dependent methyltransferase [Candidatus Elarobacter sp.]
MIYSCVVDPQPAFVHQLAIWAATLTGLAAVRRDAIVVHVLDGEYRREAVELLDERGIAHRPLARFGDGRYCNKIAQLRDPALRAARYVALCDTDLAFCGPLEPYAAGGIAAKPVDLPNPPLALLTDLYRRAGFVRLPPVTRCTHDDAPTFANNCNGGVYLVRSDLLEALAPRWERWALWTLERAALLGEHAKHADQIAFGLATWDLGEPVVPLPPEANFPLHLPLERYRRPAAAPVVMHYHDRIGADGFVLPLGIPPADERVRKVNEFLRGEQREGFDNARFWNFRYETHPELGSGLGSRGPHAAEKRRLLRTLIAAGAPESVLDVGCGDLHVAHDLPVANYLGLDVSAEAIRIARERRPDWRFAVGDLLSAELAPADLVVCLDVLIHERDPERYRAAVRRLAELTRRELVIAAYNQPPWLTSAMTFYHEPITMTLAACDGFAGLEIVGGYRDTTVVRASR